MHHKDGKRITYYVLSSLVIVRQNRSKPSVATRGNGVERLVCKIFILSYLIRARHLILSRIFDDCPAFRPSLSLVLCELQTLVLRLIGSSDFWTSTLR